MIAMNGLSFRAEPLWMARASTSLPVPVGPLISTVMSAAATRSARASSASDSGSAAVGISGPPISARAKPLPTAVSSAAKLIRAGAPSRDGVTSRPSQPITTVRAGAVMPSPSATRNRSFAPGCAISNEPTPNPCARSDETSAYFREVTAADGKIERMVFPLDDSRNAPRLVNLWLNAAARRQILSGRVRADTRGALARTRPRLRPCMCPCASPCASPGARGNFFS